MAAYNNNLYSTATPSQQRGYGGIGGQFNQQPNASTQQPADPSGGSYKSTPNQGQAQPKPTGNYFGVQPNVSYMGGTSPTPPPPTTQPSGGSSNWLANLTDLYGRVAQQGQNQVAADAANAPGMHAGSDGQPGYWEGLHTHVTEGTPLSTYQAPTPVPTPPPPPPMTGDAVIRPQPTYGPPLSLAAPDPINNQADYNKFRNGQDSMLQGYFPPVAPGLRKPGDAVDTGKSGLPLVHRMRGGTP